MIPYWVLFGGFAAAAMVSPARLERQKAGAILIIAAALVTVMVGLRHWVGGDYSSYLAMFQDIRRLPLSGAFQQGVDPAYALLNWVAGRLGGGVWLVNIVCGAILMWGVMAVAVRQPNPWLVFVVAIPYLIIVVGMGYTRQSAAIGLTLVALGAFLNRRWLWFIGALIAAALFHRTAIIIFPVAALTISKNRLVTTALIGMLAGILYMLLIRSEIDELSRNYIGAKMVSEGAWIRVMMNVIPAILFLGAQHWFGFPEAERKLWKNVSIAALLTAAALYVIASSTVVDRLALYFMVIQLVVLARVPWAFAPPGALRQLMFGAVVVYSAAIQFVWLNFSNYAHWWVPYGVVPSLAPL